MRKKHYVVLDGLRGVAAIAVMILHAAYTFRLAVPAHAYLAVDFFFCLSGFVIAHAYDRAFAERRLTFTAFARKRLIRLYPMVLAGSLIGGCATLVSATHSDPTPLWIVGVLTASSAALIPAGIAFGFMSFAVDTPLWSLFFEAIANVGYGALADRILSRWVVMATLVGSAMAVIIASVLGHGVQDLGYQGSVWFVGGMARMVYPFLIGVLISRLGLAEGNVTCPDLAIGGVLAALLLGPSLGPLWAYDAVAILIAFPAVVVIGARANPSPALDRAWKFLGDISYPLYAIHYPLLSLFRKIQHHVLHAQSDTMAAVLAGISALIISWLAFRFYDVPLRRWMESWRSGRHQQAALSLR